MFQRKGKEKITKKNLLLLKKKKSLHIKETRCLNLIIATSEGSKSTIETSLHFEESGRGPVFGDGGECLYPLVEGGQVGVLGVAAGHQGVVALQQLEKGEVHEGNLWGNGFCNARTY